MQAARRQPMKRLLVAIAALLSCAGVRASESEFFEKQVRPLLIEHCQECHGDQKQEAGLKFTSREALLRGGDTGPAIVPDKPAESLLIRAVEYLDEPKMPPSGKLSDAQIAVLKKWVESGATWPESPTPDKTESSEGGFRVTPAQREWWAFQAIADAPPPLVANESWVREPLDRFVLSKLEAQGFSPAPEADRRTWLRRVTFDVIGLPPTPEELRGFLADESEQAYERVVDRLLASSAYGERWARHWLDIARYADFHDGNPKARTVSCEPLNAWRYRDWVVQSLNRDLPFDQFVIHQIAGDLLPSPDDREFYEDGLVATTFLTNGVWDRGDADKEKIVSDMVDDNIDTIGKAFMGLTFGCARCHDHKFDPFSQADYYALAGIFYSTHVLKELGAKGGEYTLNRVPLVEKSYVDRRDEQVRKLAEINAKLAGLDKRDPKPAADDPERISLTAGRDAAQKELLPEPPVAEAVSEGGMQGGLFPGIQDVPIHIRGSYARLGPVVPRRMPEFLAGGGQPLLAGSGRRQLADWVVSRDNPLTARVIANRIWQWHFGTGLVSTPNNFGLLSQPPSHPALLDWLASQLIDEGWSLKKLHRRILLSATYRQSSQVPREQVDRDPENQLFGRFVPRRLEAEAIRDAMLAASGRLDRVPGGPASDDLSITRRSLYVQTARWDRGSFAMLFDAANPDASDEKRLVSTVAPQALFLLNSPFTLAQAKYLAERLGRDVASEAADGARMRIRLAYELLFGRFPTDDELEVAIQLVTSSDGDNGWIDLAHVLLCSNEFVYVD